MQKKSITLVELFCIFLRIGGFTFGGGYAMLPLIEKELVDDKGVLTSQEFMDIIAVIQGIPGVIAINSSLFIGYKLKGILGALVAVFAIIFPALLIISMVAKTLLNLQYNKLVVSLFTGIRACVIVLIFWAGYKMSKKAIIKKTSILYTLGMVVGMLVFNIHPIILIILSGLISIAYNLKLKEHKNDTN